MKTGHIESTTRGKRRKVLAITGIVTYAVVATGWFFAKDYYDIPAAAGELDAAVARAKELGMPLEAEDLRTKPPATDQENGFDLVMKLRPLNNEISFTDTIQDQFSLMEKDSKAFTKIPALLNSLDSVLTHFRIIAKKPRLDSHYDHDLPWKVPTYAHVVQSGVRLLGLSAENYVYAGQLDKALLEMDLAFCLSELQLDDPTNFLAAGNYNSNLQDLRISILRILQYLAKDSEALSRVKQTLQKHPCQDTAVESIRGNFYEGLAYLRNADARGLTSFNGLKEITHPDSWILDPKVVRYKGFEGSRAQRAFIARYLQSWTEIWPLLPLLKTNPLKALAEDKRITDKRYDFLDKTKGWSYESSGNSFATIRGIGSASLIALAVERTTLGLIDCLRYRNRTGKFPHSVAEAGCKLKDPFTNLPLRVSYDGNVFRVYSVGQDGKDNAGLSGSEVLKQTGVQFQKDIFATYPVISPRY